MPSKQSNSNSQLRWGLYRLNNANKDILLSGSLSAFNLVALDHYIKQLRKVGNKSDQSNVTHQSNKPKQSNGTSTTATTAPSSASFKSASVCATPSNRIGCTPSACAKPKPASPYFESTTIPGRKSTPTDAIKYRAKPTKQSATQGENECGRSWDSFSTRFNSKTKFGSTQHISNDEFWAVNTKRSFNERPNNDGTINNNPFISNSI